MVESICFAVLLLKDGNAEVSANNIGSLLKAANVKNVDKSLIEMFATSYANIDVDHMLDALSSVSGGGAAAPASGGAPVAAAAAPVAEEKKPESEDESDGDMGFDLFG